MEDRGEEASQQIRADRTQHWSARVLRSGALAWLLVLKTGGFGALWLNDSFVAFEAFLNSKGSPGIANLSAAALS